MKAAAFLTEAIFLSVRNLVSADVSSVCIAGQFPGPDACEPCPSADIRADKCIRRSRAGFRRMLCHESVEACCEKDTEVLRSSPSARGCISKSARNSMAARVLSAVTPTTTVEDIITTAPENVTVKSDTVLSVIQTKHEYCSTVASLNSGYDNDHCMKLCDDLMADGKELTDSEAFNRSCAHQHWHESNGRSVIEGQCFDKWIYGHSPSFLVSGQDFSSYIKGLVVDTPAQCQLLCQKDADCVSWLWATEIYTVRGAEAVHRCSLKNTTMVEKALQIKTGVGLPKNMNGKFCNYSTPYLCTTSSYDCLKCGGEKRCVWRNDMYVSGWKHCGVTEECSLPVTSD